MPLRRLRERFGKGALECIFNFSSPLLHVKRLATRHSTLFELNNLCAGKTATISDLARNSYATLTQGLRNS